MARGRWNRLVRWGRVVLWTALGAPIIAALFLASFFAPFSPIEVGDPGAVLLFVPILIGFLLGVVLTNEEIVVATVAGLLAATFAVVLVTVFLLSPQLAGVAISTSPFVVFSLQRLALSATLLFPLVVVGSVIGRAFADLFLPSVRMREELERLREETRRWHEALDRFERRGGGGKPPEGGKD